MQSLSPYQTALHSGNAYWMARCSKEAYLKVSDSQVLPAEDKILADLQKDDPGFQSVKGYSKNSAQAAMIECPN